MFLSNKLTAILYTVLLVYKNTIRVSDKNLFGCEAFFCEFRCNLEAKTDQERHLRNILLIGAGKK